LRSSSPNASELVARWESRVRDDHVAVTSPQIIHGDDDVTATAMTT
jgi:hypothetical protein